MCMFLACLKTSEPRPTGNWQNHFLKSPSDCVQTQSDNLFSASLGLLCVCVTSELTQGLYRRGAKLSDATLSNQATHQRGKHPPAMDVYLRIYSAAVGLYVKASSGLCYDAVV